jgi:Na+-translocating ferredoxin:NAD+ oxidoreductase RnfD subunit
MWEDWYRMVPGSPGEMFGVVIVILGVVLFLRGVLAWRPGVSFVLSFLAASAVLGQPLLFSLFSGSVLFAAVFIAGDPGSLPAGRGGQWAAGCVAGAVNALVRSFTFYSEGIVFAFLAANLLTPTFDRIAFTLRGRHLRRLQQRAASRRAAHRGSGPAPGAAE